MDEFDDIGPCVVMASPGMMQSGLSRELFESWCSDKKSGVIIAGYCVEGTLAKHLLNESPSEITTMAGQRVKVNCTVEYISFSAHTDFKQTTQFVRALKPAHIVLVHGEQTEMQKLKDALIRQYEDNPDYDIQVYNPRNTQPVELYFRGEKSAKVIGKLAAQTLPKDDQEISGILVKRNFKYHLMSPEDLPNYTDMAISSITQRQSIPIKCDPDFLIASLQRIFGNVKSTSGRHRFFDLIDLVFENNYIVLEWNSSPINDFYADSILAEILKLELEASSSSAVNRAKESAKEVIKAKSTLEQNFLNTLNDMFGELKVVKQEDQDECIVNIDEQKVQVNFKEFNVKCETDKQIEFQVQNVLNQLRNF